MVREFIRDFMLKNNISQKEVAQKMSGTFSGNAKALNQILKGHRDPSTRKLIEILDILELEIKITKKNN